MASSKQALPPAFAPVPHSYWTILGRKVSGYAQHFAIGYIIDRTLGVPGKPTWTRLSSKTLARLTGLDSKAFDFALADAVDRKLIARKRVSCDCRPKDGCDCAGRDWEYCALEANWLKVKDWDRRKLNRIEAADAPEADAPEADAPEADAPEADAPRVLVQPGKAAKPVVLSVAIKDMPTPVEMRIRPENRTPYPLAFHATVKSGAIIGLTVFSHEEAGAPEANKERRIANSTSQLKSHLVENTRSSELGNALTRLMREHWQKPLDRAFEERIALALSSAPIERFVAFATVELADAASGKRRLKSGILEWFAKSVQAVWDGEAVERRRAEERKLGYAHRLVKLGFAEEVALMQVDRWLEAGWDVDREIMRHEVRVEEAGS